MNRESYCQQHILDLFIGNVVFHVLTLSLKDSIYKMVLNFLMTFCLSFVGQDVEYIETVYEKMFKLVERGGDKKLKPEYDCICKIRTLLMEDKKQVRFADWDTKEVSGSACSP